MENNIVTLAGRFKNDIELKDYCNAQFKALEKSTKQITALEDEVRHLKELLSFSTKSIAPTHQENPTSVILAPTEQGICEIEIKRIEELTIERALTLEETKRLDILVKNLYLIKKENASIKQPLPEMNESDLVSLAQVTHEHQ